MSDTAASSLALLLIWLFEDANVESQKLSDKEIDNEFLILL